VKLSDFLTSINKTKKNVIRDSASPVLAEKLYAPFPVLRSLSYHADSVLIANELNIRGTRLHNVSKLMHYEFLLHVVSVGNRFSAWQKPEVDDRIDIIMNAFNYSYNEAKQVSDILTTEQIDKLKLETREGGR
jgi:hypothetical protein